MMMMITIINLITLPAKAVLCVDYFLIVDLSLEESGFPDVYFICGLLLLVCCGIKDVFKCLLHLTTCKVLLVAVYFENCGINIHVLIW